MTAVLALLLLVLQAPADAEGAIALGDRLLRAGDAGAAAAAYEDARSRASADGLASAALELRLGQAYLAMERLGPAVLHLERARVISPEDSLTAVTLEAAQQAVGVRTELPPAPLAQTALAVSRPTGPGALFGIGWVLLVSGLAVVGWRAWSQDARWEPWDKRAASAAIPLGALLVAVALLASAELDAARGVVQRPVALGSAPNDPSGTEVRAGRVVRLGEEAGAWRAVRLPSGAEGWLPADAVAEI